MFRHLLLPLTGTEFDQPAIAHARVLALASGATVELVRVLEAPAGGTQAIDAVEWHANRLAAQTYLDGVAAQLTAAGLTVTHSLPEGRLAENVIHRVHQGADLMVLPAGALGPSGPGMAGGDLLWRSYVSTLLVRGAPPAGAGLLPPGGLPAGGDLPVEDGHPAGEGTPATGARPETSGGADGPYAKVLVPLDGSQRAECVLPVARFFAERFAAHVVLAHVVEEPTVPRPLPLAAEETRLAARLVELNTAAAEKYLGELVEGLGGGAEARLATGRRAAPALHELARECVPDLVLMSAHGYGGDHTWPFGEVTTNLIGYGQTPLLVIHDLPWQERAMHQADVTEEAWGW